jgi:CheY-like chemotaxis protein
MNFNPLNNHRLLVIDDNQGIHALFREILLRFSALPDEPNGLEPPLFRDPNEDSRWPIFEIDSAYQGQEGLALIEKSLRENRPYSVAFVDVHMPPGWNGIETICKIWEKYSDLQVVICTGYSDYSWEQMVRPMGYLDRVVVLKKPFESIEVSQLAVAMAEKWRLNQQAKLRLDNLEKVVESLLIRGDPSTDFLHQPGESIMAADILRRTIV